MSETHFGQLTESTSETLFSQSTDCVSETQFGQSTECISETLFSQSTECMSETQFGQFTERHCSFSLQTVCLRHSVQSVYKVYDSKRLGITAAAHRLAITGPIIRWSNCNQVFIEHM